MTTTDTVIVGKIYLFLLIFGVDIIKLRLYIRIKFEYQYIWDYQQH